MLRAFTARDFPPARVLAAKNGRRVTVCLPARDEAGTIGDVVATIQRQLVEHCPIVDELVVVDDNSTDDTAAVAAAAGARVERAAPPPGEAKTSTIDPRTARPEYRAEGGKGQAMWQGLRATTGDVVMFCDADIRSFDPGFVLGLIGPLLEHGELGFVKGYYDRPLDGRPGEGGRVTELVARPLIALLFEDLAEFVQPLAGECAGRRDVLEAVPFVGGYGVDLGLLIDISTRFGTAAMAQSDLGERVHRNRPLAELSAQALGILQCGLARTGHLEPSRSTTLVRPDGTSVQVSLSEQPPLASVPAGRQTALKHR